MSDFDPAEVERLATGGLLTWHDAGGHQYFVYDDFGRKVAKFDFMPEKNGYELAWIAHGLIRPEFLNVSRKEHGHVWTNPTELLGVLTTFHVQELESAPAIVANYLFEGRVDAAMRKYPGIDKKVWEVFTKQDPSGGRQKYIDWIAKSWSKLAEEDRPEPENVMKWLKELHKRKVDINAMSGLEELESTATGETMGGRRGRILKKTTVLLDNPDWLIVIPDSHEASQFYGGSTKWCVATSNFKYWYDYKTEGELVFIKDRHKKQGDRLWKVAIYWHESNAQDDPLGWEWFDTYDRKLDDEEKSYLWNEIPPGVREAIIETFENCDPYQYRDQYEGEYITADWQEGDGKKNVMKTVKSMIYAKAGVDLTDVDLLRQLNTVSDGHADRILGYIHYVGFLNADGQFEPDNWYVDYEMLEQHSEERCDREELDAIDEIIAMNSRSGRFLEVIQNALDYWQFKNLIRYWGEENLLDRLNDAAYTASWKLGSRPGDTPPVNVYSYEQLLDILRSADPALHDYLTRLSTTQESVAPALVVRLLG